MSIIVPDRALMYLRKGHALLRVILDGVDQARATATRDGDNGWTTLEVVCHLNDYEQIFIDREKAMLEGSKPSMTAYNPDALASQNQYAAQDFAQVLTTLYSRRAAHIKLLESLTPEQWNLTGVHPNWGEITITENAFNAALHDLNHMEQIARVLGLSGIPSA